MLAVLGLVTIGVFLALVTLTRTPVIVALVVTPVAAAIVGGFGGQVGAFAVDGLERSIEDRATIAADRNTPSRGSGRVFVDASTVTGGGYGTFPDASQTLRQLRKLSAVPAS